MEVILVNSNNELLENLRKNEINYVLIYKEDSEQSKCALKNIEEIEKVEGIKIYLVNVSKIKDIHENYEVKSAPSLLEFEKDQLKSIIKGCNTPEYYKSVFEKNIFISSTEKTTQQKTVVVYSTPTCSWCNRLKDYLKKNNIRFSDVDVSRDQKAAEQMVRRSGQQGVPQTLIGGQLIIGFDKKRIDELLQIKA